MAIKGKAYVEKTNKVTKVECEASRNAEKFQCVRYLKLPQVTVVPAEYRSWWCRVNRHGPDDPSCRAKAYYNPPKLYKEKQVTITPEEWVSDCQHLEVRIPKNECKLIKSECLDKEPKIINGETITRACWKYQDTYSCQYPCLNNCSPYFKQGCKHVGSKCKFEVNN